MDATNALQSRLKKFANAVVSDVTPAGIESKASSPSRIKLKQYCFYQIFRAEHKAAIYNDNRTEGITKYEKTTVIT